MWTEKTGERDKVERLIPANSRHMDLEIRIKVGKSFLRCSRRDPRVCLDYGKINIMRSQGNGAAGCAVAA